MISLESFILGEKIDFVLSKSFRNKKVVGLKKDFFKSDQSLRSLFIHFLDSSAIHCLSGTSLLSQITALAISIVRKFQVCQDSNPGQLGEKRKRYFCAIPSPNFSSKSLLLQHSVLKYSEKTSDVRWRPLWEAADSCWKLFPEKRTQIIFVSTSRVSEVNTKFV